MPKVPLSQARPGQTLARPVTNASGVVMVQAGTVLTAGLIERFRGLGVDAVVIAAEAGAGRLSRPVEERVREVEARFEGHERDPWMMELRDIVLRVVRRGQAASDAS